jgi:hypothetical protein
VITAHAWVRLQAPQRWAAIDPAKPTWRRAAAGITLGVVSTTSLFQSILHWLRGGYPDGVPGPDRVPLLALLRATPLTEDQVREVVRNITDGDTGAASHGDITRDEIAEFISDVTHHDAGPENIRRVATRLEAAGWPLAGFDEPAH